MIAPNETEVAKLYTADTRSDIGSEAEKVQYANAVNDLIPKFIRLDFDEALQAEMLVMERIYPVDFRAHEVEKRALWLDGFLEELKELHHAGFVHCDIKRPSDILGEAFDNILLTNTCIRLIDVGVSAIKAKVGDMLFAKYLEIERKELEEFKHYFLNR